MIDKSFSHTTRRAVSVEGDFESEHGDWDFDDSIRLQRENNSLRSELHHWKSVAAQLVGTSEHSPHPGP
ncbi:hypothetical protein PoB_006206700 [Plakobranchus ocellatus]|uniref:Uncharacterized protein n=1 Tax=Plakobranchus ocellatus TaxID=259542 RepID=A0AAV4CUG4_9GAST|nr:hypothetical protein PoB_006206700 [Plakobranchus ocellatus]